MFKLFHLLKGKKAATLDSWALCLVATTPVKYLR